ncbi:MAG TPA: hypothetical protein VJL28_07250 [Gemmatimonadaceae bacterium]|nr:hypothetical protein [Gemmatimonadaceae bacterium]
MKLDLDKLERLAKAATPGPWDPGPWDAPMAGGRGQRQLVLTTAPVPHAEYGQTRELIASFSVVYVGTPPDARGRAAEDSIVQGEANAAFAAAANPAVVLALIDELRVAWDVRDKANKAVRILKLRKLRKGDK